MNISHHTKKDTMATSLLVQPLVLLLKNIKKIHPYTAPCLVVRGVQLVGLLRAQEQTGAHVVVVEAALPPQDHAHRNRREWRHQILDVRRGLVVPRTHGTRQLDRVSGLCSRVIKKKNRGNRGSFHGFGVVCCHLPSILHAVQSTTGTPFGACGRIPRSQCLALFPFLCIFLPTLWCLPSCFLAKRIIRFDHPFPLLVNFQVDFCFTTRTE